MSTATDFAVDQAVSAALARGAVPGALTPGRGGLGEWMNPGGSFGIALDVASSLFDQMGAQDRRKLNAIRASMVSRAAYDWEVRSQWFLIGALEAATGKKFDNASSWLAKPTHNNGKFVPGSIRFTDGSVL